MKFNSLIIFTLMIFTFYACQEVIDQSSDERDDRKIIQLPGLIEERYIGFDMDGNERSCKDNEDVVCTEIFSESDQYALDCQRNGDVAIQCGCHDWICVDPNDIKSNDKPAKITGRDIAGNIDSCEPFDFHADGQDIACSMVFTEEDQFASDCEASGFESVQCDCHKFLCLE